MLEQKYPKSLIEAGILKAKEIPLEILRQPKTTANKETIPFATTYNPNNPNIFPIIKQSFNNFQYSKIMFNIFQKKKLVNSMIHAPNLGRLLCRSEFESERKNHEVKNRAFKSILMSIYNQSAKYINQSTNKHFLYKNLRLYNIHIK